MAENNLTDSAVIRAAAAGSMDALGRLYDAYSARVYGVALHYLRSRDEAEDVAHDVFVGLPRALQQYTHEGAFWGWLRQVTVRVALMKLRAQRSTSRVCPETKDWPNSADPLDRLLLDRALTRLPDAWRLPFLLKVIEGYSHAEIATLLNITVAASTLRVFRAWRQLRQTMEQRES